MIAFSAIVLLGFGAGGPVLAAQADDVETMVKRGIDLRREGRDREALAEFQRAARVQQTPRIVAQIAAAEQALGLWSDANVHFTSAMGNTGDEWIAKNRPVLEKALAAVRSHLGEIEIWGGPSGAEVRFDDVVVGRLPSITTWLSPGEVSMKVSSAGHSTVVRPVVIPMGGRVREHVQLRVISTTVPAGGGEPLASRRAIEPRVEGSGGPAGSGPREGAGADAGAGEAPESTDVPIYRRWWFWVAVAAVGVGAATGAYLLTRDSQTCGMPPCDTF